jgi:hypothetical protein
VCAPDSAPTLLFSDEPESPTSSGVLYADTLPAGRTRVYVYHANGGAQARRFSLVALNPGAAMVTATIGPRAIAGPTQAYVAAGRAVARSLLEDTSTRQLALPPGVRVVVDPDLDGRIAAQGELVHAIIELDASGPLKLSVVTVAPGTDAAAATSTLPLLPSTGVHVRGTFARADRLLVIDAERFGRLRLGTGATEPLLSGRSAVDNLDVTLSGSYGVVYRVATRAGSTAPLSLFLSPRGGAWAGGATLPAGLDGPAGALALPTSPPNGLGDPMSAIAWGRFGASTAIEAQLLTGGGSSLPVDLLLVPQP